MSPCPIGPGLPTCFSNPIVRKWVPQLSLCAMAMTAAGLILFTCLLPQVISRMLELSRISFLPILSGLQGDWGNHVHQMDFSIPGSAVSLLAAYIGADQFISLTLNLLICKEWERHQMGGARSMVRMMLISYQRFPDHSPRFTIIEVKMLFAKQKVIHSCI